MGEISALMQKNWKQIKKDAGVKKTAWYKKSTASVGGLIEKVSSAHSTWKSAKPSDERSMRMLTDYLTALENLERGLKKFAKEKDFSKDVDGDLQDLIEDWLAAVKKKTKKLAQLVNVGKEKLLANDGAAMMKVLSYAGTTGK